MANRGRKSTFSQDDVFNAVVSLLANGKSPTIANVRAELGNKGSPNALQPAREQAFIDIGKAFADDSVADVASAIPGSVSEQLPKGLAELWNCAIKEADRHLATELKNAWAEITELKIQNQSLEDSRARLKTENEALRDESDSDAFKEARDELSSQVAQLKHENEHLEAKSAHDQEQIEWLRARVETYESGGSPKELAEENKRLVEQVAECEAALTGLQDKLRLVEDSLTEREELSAQVSKLLKNPAANQGEVLETNAALQEEVQSLRSELTDAIQRAEKAEGLISMLRGHARGGGHGRRM